MTVARLLLEVIMQAA